jgi:hypothetical protein
MPHGNAFNQELYTAKGTFKVSMMEIFSDIPKWRVYLLHVLTRRTSKGNTLEQNPKERSDMQGKI